MNKKALQAAWREVTKRNLFMDKYGDNAKLLQRVKEQYRPEPKAELHPPFHWLINKVYKVPVYTLPEFFTEKKTVNSFRITDSARKRVGKKRLG